MEKKDKFLINEEDISKNIELYKYCYDTYISFLDSTKNKKNLIDFASSNDTNINTIYYNARTYFVDILGKSSEEWMQIIKKAIDKKFLTDIYVDLEKNGEEFYNLYVDYLNSVYSQEEYEKILEERELDRTFVTNVAKKYAFEVKKESKEEWETRRIDLNNRNKEKNINECEQYYEEYLKYLDSELTSDEFTDYLKRKMILDRDEFTHKVEYYVKNKLGISLREWNEQNTDKLTGRKEFGMLWYLSKVDTITDFKELIDFLGGTKKLDELLASIENDERIIRYEESDKSTGSKRDYKNIREKLELCSKYYEMEKKFSELKMANRSSINAREKDIQIEQNIEKYRKIILDYINGGYYSIKDYCSKNNIEVPMFNSIVEIISIKDKELYEQYRKVAEKHSVVRYAELMRRMTGIINMIDNGITDDDKNTRKFDILDYYRMTSLPYSEIFEATKKGLTADQAKSFKKFADENKIVPFQNIKEEVLEAKLIRNGKEISFSEKEIILKYLKKNGIPVSYRTFSTCLSRNLHESLIEEQNKMTNMNEENKTI